MRSTIRSHQLILSLRFIGIVSPNDEHQRPEPAAAQQRVRHGQNGWLPSAACCGSAYLYAGSLKPERLIRLSGGWQHSAMHIKTLPVSQNIFCVALTKAFLNLDVSVTPEAIKRNPAASLQVQIEHGRFCHRRSLSLPEKSNQELRMRNGIRPTFSAGTAPGV